MAESRAVTGSRDDLLIDASRCLRMRFCESSCRRCIDICPHGAVSLDGSLFIDPQLCRGCLLCTSVCPVGALEQNFDFVECLAQLSRVPEPVFGCIRTKENANAAMACLGGLSEEHLLAIYHTLSERLTLNLSLCSDCSNSSIITEIEQRLAAISAAGLSCDTCRNVLAGSGEDIRLCDTSVDRRSFFKSFGKALFKNAADILSSTKEQTEKRVEYAGKRVPFRRELLNKARAKLSPEMVALLRIHFDVNISFDENCTKCHGCVAICPTGALMADLPDTPPKRAHLPCTGCGLCEEFCLERAILIYSGSIQEYDQF